MRQLLIAVFALAAIGALAEPVDIVNSPRPQQFVNGAYFGPGTPNGQVTVNTELYAFGDAGIQGNLIAGGSATFGSLIMGDGGTSFSFFASATETIAGGGILPWTCLLQSPPISPTIPGANMGDVCVMGGQPGVSGQPPQAGINYECQVNGNSQCVIYACNLSPFAITIPAGTARCTVIH